MMGEENWVKVDCPQCGMNQLYDLNKDCQGCAGCHVVFSVKLLVETCLCSTHVDRDWAKDYQPDVRCPDCGIFQSSYNHEKLICVLCGFEFKASENSAFREE